MCQNQSQTADQAHRPEYKFETAPHSQRSLRSDGINTVMCNALLGQGNERRCAKINRKPPTRRIDQNTSLKPPPTPKGVSDRMASILLCAMPCWVRAMSDDVPKSIANRRPGASTRIQV